MLINNIEFKVGCDPEVFVVDGDKKLVSAYGMLEGTKAKPQKTEHGHVQVDGMALEFNTKPAALKSDFVDGVEGVLTDLKKFLPKNHELLIEPVAEFGEEYIKSQPLEATELGCDPDYNAYTGDVNPTPSGDVPFRTAAGHIHIGWTKDVDPFDEGHFEACRELVKYLDRNLGVPSVVIDTDTRRRDLYGKAGAFRPKSYGVEYRVLSNFWIGRPKLRRMVWKGVTASIKNLFASNGVYEEVFGDEDLLQPENIINNSLYDDAMYATQNVIPYSVYREMEEWM